MSFSFSQPSCCFWNSHTRQGRFILWLFWLFEWDFDAFDPCAGRPFEKNSPPQERVLFLPLTEKWTFQMSEWRLVAYFKRSSHSFDPEVNSSSVIQCPSVIQDWIIFSRENCGKSTSLALIKWILPWLNSSVSMGNLQCRRWTRVLCCRETLANIGKTNFSFDLFVKTEYSRVALNVAFKH